jgi:putative flippase GtrA
MLGLVYLLNTILDIHYLVATGAAFAITLCVSYVVHKYWTFQNTEPLHRKQFAGHVFLTCWNFFLNIGLVYLCVEFLHTPALVAQIVSSATIAVQSFLIYHGTIFITLPERKA